MRLTKTFSLGSMAAQLSLVIIAIAFCVSGAPQPLPKRKIPCKVTENAGLCYWAHGRLNIANGTPTIRLWKIRTKRILAIYSGPGYNKGNDRENESPELPANVEAVLSKSRYGSIFGDFEICPLEPEVAGEMQDACIESGKNFVVDK
jgi:hypothetical protein